MIQKMDYYDLLNALVPGTVLLCSILVLFPLIAKPLQVSGIPTAFEVIALIVVAFILGNLVQTVGSAIEPLLFWSWSGRPSDLALMGGLKGILPVDTSNRIREKLQAVVGVEATSHSLFLYAVQCCVSSRLIRVSRFNGYYVFHRNMIAMYLLLAGLLLLSLLCGKAGTWPFSAWAVVLGLLLLMVVAEWHRSHMRALYYVREVLLGAETLLDRRNRTT